MPRLLRLWLVLQWTKQQTEYTKCKFDVAYTIAKENLAFTKMKPLCELRSTMGLSCPLLWPPFKRWYCTCLEQVLLCEAAEVCYCCGCLWLLKSSKGVCWCFKLGRQNNWARMWWYKYQHWKESRSKGTHQRRHVMDGCCGVWHIV